GRMTHLKLMLIDDSYLIIGSANFDYLSYRSQQEIIAVITDSEVISNVKDKVIKEDLQNSIRFEGEISIITGYMSAVTLKSLLRLSVFLGDCC
ncbi:MAG: phospholipase D-like domain-containing protein, partial [Candidatus Zixiibacteriota bacterium]